MWSTLLGSYYEYKKHLNNNHHGISGKKRITTELLAYLEPYWETSGLRKREKAKFRVLSSLGSRLGVPIVLWANEQCTKITE